MESVGYARNESKVRGTVIIKYPGRLEDPQPLKMVKLLILLVIEVSIMTLITRTLDGIAIGEPGGS